MWNEDVLFPEKLLVVKRYDFDNSEEDFAGFELIFEKTDSSFIVGYNRRRSEEAMYGWLKILGTPVKSVFNE